MRQRKDWWRKLAPNGRSGFIDFGLTLSLAVIACMVSVSALGIGKWRGTFDCIGAAMPDA